MQRAPPSTIAFAEERRRVFHLELCPASAIAQILLEDVVAVPQGCTIGPHLHKPHVKWVKAVSKFVCIIRVVYFQKGVSLDSLYSVFNKNKYHKGCKCCVYFVTFILHIRSIDIVTFLQVISIITKFLYTII